MWEGVYSQIRRSETHLSASFKAFLNRLLLEIGNREGFLSPIPLRRVIPSAALTRFVNGMARLVTHIGAPQIDDSEYRSTVYAKALSVAG